MSPAIFKVLVCGITNEEAVEAKIREIMPDLVIVYHHNQPHCFPAAMRIARKMYGDDPHEMQRMQMCSAVAPGTIYCPAATIDLFRKGRPLEMIKFVLEEDPQEVQEAADNLAKAIASSED